VNVVGQIFFIDYFLGFGFTRYGLDVINFSLTMPDDRVDPMSELFPKVDKMPLASSGNELVC